MAARKRSTKALDIERSGEGCYEIVKKAKSYKSKADIQ